ncbi:MAG TPA: glycosyltransferase family 2 protein [Gammaproteobacteria bacterium]|nr:glycosyltransferase family 2 protein [Gammaproteobacteria bacterium]
MQSNITPVVNFIIPVYNAEKYILRSVNSALKQNHIIPKVIVVNHGSIDQTEQIIVNNFKDDAGVKLINLSRQLNERSSATRPLNCGCSSITCDTKEDSHCWVMRLDADDFLATNNIIIDVITKGNCQKMISGMLTFFEEDNCNSYIYGPKKKYRNKIGMLKKGAYAGAHHATLIRYDFLKTLENFPSIYDEQITYGEDLDLTLRLFNIINHSEHIFLDDSILFKSLNTSSLTSNTKKIRIWNDLKYVFSKNKSLSKILLIRLAFDLLLRDNNKFIRLRKLLGYPGHHVGEILPMPTSDVISRLEDLNQQTVENGY